MESCLNVPGAIDQGVDWSAPWLTLIRQRGIEVAAASDWRNELNRQARCAALYNENMLAICFVDQQVLPAGASYEAYIYASGQVPTRDNLHDFFNALVWLTFPRIKARLNALQAAQIAQLGIGKSRGPSRDAATLFDENAALLAVTDNATGRDLVDALRCHQWQTVFIARRDEFVRHASVCLFGHAIMEKLVRPYKAITAHTLLSFVADDFHRLPLTEQCAILDTQIATQLQSAPLLPNAFSPLPILGVPGWWPKQDIQFYGDTGVFRPKREK